MNDFDRRLKDALVEVRDAGRFAADARKEVVKERLLRRMRRRRWFLGAAGTLAAGGAVVLGVALFSSGPGDGIVRRPDVGPVDFPRRARAVVQVGDGPEDLSVGGLRYVWSSNVGANTLSRIDPATNEQILEVELPSRVGDLAIGNGPVWVGLPEEGTVVRVGGAAGRILGDPVTVADGPVEDIELTIGAGAVWAVVRGEHVVRIDLETRTATRLLESAQPTDVAVKGSIVRVLDAAGLIHQLDSATGAEAAGPLAVEPHDDGEITFAAGSIWYFTDEGDTVTRIDPSTGESTATIDPEGLVVDFVIDPEVSWVLTRSGSGDSASFLLTPIDQETTEPAGDPIQVEGEPAEMVITGRSLWLSLTGEDVVLRFSKYY